MRLLLARHGETTWNFERRYQGHHDTPLSARGEVQARRLGLRLAGEPIDAVYASDLQRAWRTAEIALADRGLTVMRDPAWREMCYGTWQGLTRAEIAARDPVGWARRQADSVRVAPPEGENRLQVLERAVAAARRLRARHAGETVLVVTHGGVLAALSCWCRGLELDAGEVVEVANAGLSCVEWTSEPPALAFWNDAGHVGA